MLTSKPKRKIRRRTEFDEAVIFTTLVRRNLRSQYKYLFHIPNGAGRSFAIGKKLKAQGVKAGIPDYFLAIPTKEYSGLFIELKSRTGTASDAQKKYLKDLRESGYRCELAKGGVLAFNIVKDYLGVE